MRRVMYLGFIDGNFLWVVLRDMDSHIADQRVDLKAWILGKVKDWTQIVQIFSIISAASDSPIHDIQHGGHKS